MAVDALFTAVTARDDKLLGESERRLHALKDAGTLSDNASASLDDIIKTARNGGWESAAQTLYDFMKGQRRFPARFAHDLLEFIRRSRAG